MKVYRLVKLDRVDESVSYFNVVIKFYIPLSYTFLSHILLSFA